MLKIIYRYPKQSISNDMLDKYKYAYDSSNKKNNLSSRKYFIFYLLTFSIMNCKKYNLDSWILDSTID